MGILTLRRFGRKVQAFETALDDGVSRRQFKRDEFEVLVLTQSRLEALRQAPAALWMAIAAATTISPQFDAVAPSAFATATWQDLDGRRDVRGVRYAE